MRFLLCIYYIIIVLFYNHFTILVVRLFINKFRPGHTLPQKIPQLKFIICRTSSVRTIFERGGRKFENNEDEKKNFSTQNQFVFLPKNKVFTQILSFCVLKLSAQVTRGGAMPQFCILFYANYTILATQRRPWHHAPP